LVLGKRTVRERVYNTWCEGTQEERERESLKMVSKETSLSMYVDEWSSIILVERKLNSSMKEYRTISSLCQVRGKEESSKPILPIRYIRDTIL